MKQTTVHIVNEIMGGGKTSAMITEMRNHLEKKFIYLTPSLKETERVSTACPELSFRLPMSNKDPINPDPKKPNSKSLDYENLLELKRNICATHKLFFIQDKSISELYENYSLVMDEAPNMLVQNIDLDEDDAETVYKHYVSFEDGEKATWKRSKGYNGSFVEVKETCDKGFLEGVSSEKKSYLYNVFPAEVLKKFKDIYILTYMPEYQGFYYYLEDNDFLIDYLYVKNDEKNYYLTAEPQPRKYFDYAELIEIVGGPKGKYNFVGEGKHALSKNAYKDGRLRRTMRSNLRNFFTSSKASSDDFLWTVFKEYKDSISGGRFNTSFLSCNSKSTNDYGNRHVVAYLINLFQKPANSYYYKSHGIKTVSTGFALTEMLQFIWRSAIRNGEKIKLYIPSKRMRNLLIAWIDYVAGRSDKIEGLDTDNHEQFLPENFEDFYIAPTKSYCTGNDYPFEYDFSPESEPIVVPVEEQSTMLALPSTVYSKRFDSAYEALCVPYWKSEPHVNYETDMDGFLLGYDDVPEGIGYEPM